MDRLDSKDDRQREKKNHRGRGDSVVESRENPRVETDEGE